MPTCHKPGCECGGAEVVSKADPVFFCLTCLNVDLAYALRPVIFPGEASAIEAALLERKDGKNRNWIVGESVEKLKREHEEHKER